MKHRLWVEAFWAVVALVDISIGVHIGDGGIGAIGGALLAIVYRDVLAELHLIAFLRERKVGRQ